MKFRLIRPSAVLFPIALIAAYVLGNPDFPALLLLFYFGLQICSLCSVGSYRNAAAREPGPRRADQRFFAAFFTLLLTSAAAFFLLWKYRGDENLEFLLAAALVLFEQLFEERLFTLNRPGDGALLALLSNGLLFAGMMIDSVHGVTTPLPVGCFYTLCASAGGLLIGMIASLAIAPPRGFTLLPRNLGFAPKAMVQELLCPAAIFALCCGVMTENIDGYAQRFLHNFTRLCLPALALWRLSRTNCRRAGNESRPMNLILISLTAAAVVGSAFAFPLFGAALSMPVVLLCAAVVFLAPSVRLYLGVALVLAGFACLGQFFEYWQYACAGCCLLAVVLNLKGAFRKMK